MIDFRKYFHAVAVVAFLASLAVPAYAQFTCNNFNAVNVPVRAESFDDLGGDIQFECTGGSPTLPGSVVPSVNITVSANTNITSRILATIVAGGVTTNFNEALLIIDEPNTTRWSPGGRPIANCGASGADSGPDGPGVCRVISPASPTNTYDGAVGVAATGLAGADVACAHASDFGCGRPNVFQGRIKPSLISGQFNAIQFLEVPFDPPAANSSRSVRIMNVRVDATHFGVISLFSTVSVIATVSFSGSTTITVPDTNVNFAQVQVGVTTKVFGFTGFLQCAGTDTILGNSASSPFYSGSGLPIGTGAGQSPTGGMDIRVFENFAIAWKEKNVAGHLANGTFNGSIYAYNGGMAAPPTSGDNAQNVPGAIYETESGFEYNSGTAVLSPNPPDGFGVGAVANVGRPFFDASTNIQAAGEASEGTRIAVQVSTPLPNGALLFFPIVVALKNQFTGLQSGVMVADVLVDQNGFGAPFLAASPTAFSFSPSGGGAPVAIPKATSGFNWVQVTAAAPVITYEVLFSNPGALEYADIIPAVVYNNNGLASNLPHPGVLTTATASFAPIQSGIANQPQPDGVYATPRFMSTFKSPADTLFSIGVCPQTINGLIAQVMNLGLSNGETTSLTAKLEAALGYVAGGDTAAAIAVLQAFINEVNALVKSHRLTAAAAAPLILAAKGIIATL